MNSLVEWLRDQLAHDEAHARKDLWAAEKSTTGRWRARYGVNLAHSWIETESAPVLRLDGPQHEADALLVARMQPETVKKRAEARLAHIEATRQILDEHKPGRPKGRPNRQPGCLTCTTGQAWDERAREANCLTLRLLAMPYADQPGYREDWKP